MAFPFVGAPVGLGAVRLAWVVVTVLGGGLLIRRALRMAVIADNKGIVVRNLGRDYAIGWDCIAEIRAGRSDNVTGAAKTIYIIRTDGSQVAARAANCNYVCPGAAVPNRRSVCGNSGVGGATCAISRGV